MRNTETRYLSSIRNKPMELAKLATLLPSLSEEQHCALAEDILRNDCYAPINVNEDVAIVDGHIRQSFPILERKCKSADQKTVSKHL